MLFIFALAFNILALLAALIIVLLGAFIAKWGSTFSQRPLVRTLSFVSVVIPAVGLWLCFNHLLGIAVGIGLLTLACYIAVVRYLILLLESVARP